MKYSTRSLWLFLTEFQPRTMLSMAVSPPMLVRKLRGYFALDIYSLLKNSDEVKREPFKWT